MATVLGANKEGNGKTKSGPETEPLMSRSQILRIEFSEIVMGRASNYFLSVEILKSEEESLSVPDAVEDDAVSLGWARTEVATCGEKNALDFQPMELSLSLPDPILDEIKRRVRSLFFPFLCISYFDFQGCG